MARVIDRTLPEWRILDDVRPLFAATLPWHVVDDQSGGYGFTLLRLLQWPWRQVYGAGTNAANITIETSLQNFQYDMMYLPARQPQGGLNEQLYQFCQGRLRELLKALENLIHVHVIDAAKELSRESTSQNDHVGSQPAGVSAISQTASSLDLQAMDTWLRGLPKELATFFLGQQPSSPTATTVDEEHPFRKLEALGSIVQDCIRRKADIAKSCGKFVETKHTLKEHENILEQVGLVIMCFEGIAETSSPADRFRALAEKHIPETRWQNLEPWEISHQLFSILTNVTCYGHEARLQLDGFKLDGQGRSLSLDVFVSSCPPVDPACSQEGRYTYVTKQQITLRKDIRLITTMCYPKPDVSTQPGASLRNLLSIEFDSSLAYQLLISHEPSICVGATPTQSLTYLLEEGYLRDLGQRESLFTELDKAILALSLGRCLLHLFGGSWMKQTWCSDDIHFLYKRTDSMEEIFNIHHPYVTCKLPQTKEEKFQNSSERKTWPKPTFKPAECGPFLWSFGKLLLEIKTGRRLPKDEDLWIVLANQPKPSRVDYDNAVQGSLRFVEFVQNTAGATPSLVQVREVLYDHVIKHLEATINSFSNPMSLIYRRDICLKVPVASAPVVASKQSLPEISTAIEKSHSQSEGTFFAGFHSHLLSIPQTSGEISTKSFDNLNDTIDKRLQYTPDDPRVKVAIIDTGCDLDHKDFKQARTRRFDGEIGNMAHAATGDSELPQRGRIKGWKNFCPDRASSEDVSDLDGHGTLVAGIILRLAPHADLYIARVCTGDVNYGVPVKEMQKVEAKPYHEAQPKAVAAAVRWARKNGVHIINLSLGYRVNFGYKMFKVLKDALNDEPEEDALGEDAPGEDAPGEGAPGEGAPAEGAPAEGAQRKNATREKIIVFAATSNDGIHKRVVWPAKNIDYAIGVHSSIDDGTAASTFSPKPFLGANITVVGENILSQWPEAKGGGFRTCSGTSFATPVAAAIGALVLSFMWQQICAQESKTQDGSVLLEEILSNNGMSRVLKGMSTEVDGYSIIDMSLFWKDYLDEMDSAAERKRSRKHAWDKIKAALGI